MTGVDNADDRLLGAIECHDVDALRAEMAGRDAAADVGHARKTVGAASTVSA